jgi:polyphosphate kinase
VTDRSTTSRPGVAVRAPSPTAAPVVRRRGPVWPDLVVDAAPAGDGEPFGDVAITSQPSRFLNRDLSWLEFGARLLELAADDRLPLLDRVDFLALFAEGLDQLFQVQVAGLEDQVAAGLRTRSPDGLSPDEQCRAIGARAAELVVRQNRLYAEELEPALRAQGIVVTDWHDLEPADREHLEQLFDRQVFPVLTPLAVDQAHPFPYISNLSLNLVVRVTDPTSGDERIARVKVPPVLPRFVVLPDGRRLLAIEQVIAAHLGALFPAMEISEHHVFRVTRNVDLSVEDEVEDWLAAVELELHRRRFGQAVRLEVSAGIPPDLLAMLVEEVGVAADSVLVTDVPVDLGGLRAVGTLDRPDLRSPLWAPVVPSALADSTQLFAALSADDVLVHHPYESFAASVESFVSAAADDPDVLAIKQTLYRVGGDNTVTDALIRASLAGKEVTAVVELQARFDERVNIAQARALEEAGVQVVYGLRQRKTHSKMLLVVRRERESLRRYCHIGTGNYNSATARSYEDLGLFTSDADIGADVGELFNVLAGSAKVPSLRRLVASPFSTREMLMAHIVEETEAGEAGTIAMKVNGLTDPGIIDALYAASAGGCRVDLVVRGRCCLRPGVPGLSERITVRSIVGRYLEHSRIFRFGGTERRPLHLYLGSADVMERSLDRRVEVLVPVDDPAIRQRLLAILDAAADDEVNSWVLGPEGEWERVPEPVGDDRLPFSLQAHLAGRALESRRPETDPGTRPVMSPAPARIPDGTDGLHGSDGSDGLGGSNGSDHLLGPTARPPTTEPSRSPRRFWERRKRG